MNDRNKILEDAFSELVEETKQESVETLEEEKVEDVAAEPTESNPDDEEIVVTEEDEEEEVILDAEEEEEVVEKPLARVRPSREEKERYAFEKLRKEKDEAKAKLKELDEIAVGFGFNSHAEMIAELNKEKIKKEAAKQGVDVKVYEEIHNTKQELKKLKEERELEVKQTKINNLVTSLDNFLAKEGLTSEDKNLVLTRLEEDGYDLDTLLNIKKPEALFKGYMVDRIEEVTKQKLLAEEKRKRGLEERPLYTKEASKTKLSIDDYVEQFFKSK